MRLLLYRAQDDDIACKEVVSTCGESENVVIALRLDAR